MRVLVTGSAGFIGRHVVRALTERGDTVFEADLKYGESLTRPGVARKAMAGRPDVVIHLAATCSTPGSLTDPNGTFRNTVITAVNVLDECRQSGTPVIVTSSVKARDGWTPYGAAKRMVETWASEMRSAYGFPVVINRPGTVYGPGQEGSPESGWIAWFLKAKAEGLPVVVNGSGKQVRDLLHVSDYVNLLLKQADDIATYDGGVYDVGGGHENAVTVLDIVDWLNLTFTHGPPRYGDADRYIGLNDAPDWKPLVHWRDSETFA